MADDTSKVISKVRTTHSIRVTIPAPASSEEGEFLLSVEMNTPTHLWLTVGGDSDEDSMQIEWAAFEELFLKMKDLRDKTFLPPSPPPAPPEEKKE